MTDKEKDKASIERRLFLEKAGRFAAVTPPTVALMLSATGSARAQAGSSGTTTTTSTATTTIDPSLSPTISFTASFTAL
jgi:hypothetical protein